MLPFKIPVFTYFVPDWVSLTSQKVFVFIIFYELITYKTVIKPSLWGHCIMNLNTIINLIWRVTLALYRMG